MVNKKQKFYGKRFISFMALALALVLAFELSSQTLIVQVQAMNEASEVIAFPQSKMEVTACSEETQYEQDQATKAIDGDPNTFWHTPWDENKHSLYAHENSEEYSKKGVGDGHWIQIDLGDDFDVMAIRYLPRAAGVKISSVEIYVSSDNENYTKVAENKNWGQGNTERALQFDPTDARYVLFLAKAPEDYVSIAELNIDVIDKNKVLPITFPQSMMQADACAEETVIEADYASNVLDGNAGTFWHSPWDSNKHPQHAHENVNDYAKKGVNPGHWIQVDLGSNQPVTAIRYLPRAAGGKFTGVEVYVSIDNENYTKVAEDKNWGDGSEERTIGFNEIQGRYVLLLATSPETFVACAEFNVEVSELIGIKLPVTFPQSLMNIDVCAEETVIEQDQATNAIDGNPNTFWHSPWVENKHPQRAHENANDYSKNGVNPGHWIEVDLGRSFDVSAIRYLPRAAGGKFTGVEVYVSGDNQNYTKVSEDHNWGQGSAERVIEFEPTQGRYVLLLATSPGTFVACAEFNVEISDPGLYAVWTSAGVAVDTVNAVEIGTIVGTYRQRDKDACLEAIKTVCALDGTVEEIRAAMNKLVADFLANPIHYSNDQVEKLMSDCADLLSSLVVGVGDGNVTQVAYDKFSLAIDVAYLIYKDEDSTPLDIDHMYNDLKFIYDEVCALIATRAKLLELLDRSDYLMSNLAVGTNDTNVAQAAYDKFSLALSSAHSNYIDPAFTFESINDTIKAIQLAFDEVNNAAIVVIPNITDGKLPAYDLAATIDPDEIRFNNLEWTGVIEVDEGMPNQGRQSHIFEANREKPHSSETFPFDSLDEALKGSREYFKLFSKDELPSRIISLTNKEDLDPTTSNWKFSIVKTLTTDLEVANSTKDPLNPEKNIVDFYKSDYDISSWKGIAVPTSWQVQGVGADGVPYTGYYDAEYGYDAPYYTNVSMPGSITFRGEKYNIFDGVGTPSAPEEYNPVGFYRRDFDVPSEWMANKDKVVISFEGVEAEFYVYLNGKEVGYHADSKTPGEFDLTPFLTKDGTGNTLAVKVFRWADSSWIEDQDMVRLSGIFRDVFLTAIPSVHIRDYKVETNFDSNFEDATISLSADVSNYTSEQDFSNYNVIMQLFDQDGSPVDMDHTVRMSLYGLTADKELSISGKTVVKNPHKWSPDDPYLYTLVLSVYDKDTNVAVERIAQQFGFKEITYRSEDNSADIDFIRINGTKMTMRGVNRHDTTPDGGRYVSPETYVEDIMIMKRNNIDTLRTSHYPNDTYLYYLCDKYGIMVISEANNESHANTGNSISENNLYYHANSRVINMIEKEKNRTSVVMWSIGNESGSQAGWRSIIANLRLADNTRPIHYEGLRDWNNNVLENQNVDVNSSMYPSVDSYNAQSQGTSAPSVMMCEYAHAMGNSVGNLEEYFDVARYNTRAMGGCIWDFVDQAIWTKPNAAEAEGMFDYYENGFFLGYGGDWGEGNHDADFVGTGTISATRQEQPEMAEVKKVYQSLNFTASQEDLANGIVNVRNEYYTQDGNDFDIKWILYEDGKELGSGILDDLPSMPPMGTELILIEIPTVAIDVPFLDSLPEDAKPDAEYTLRMQASTKSDEDWADAGYIVAEDQFDLSFKSEATGFINTANFEELSVDENTEQITIDGNDFSISFDKNEGTISDYRANGVQLLTTGPEFTFYRALLSNDAAPGTAWRDVDIRGRSIESLTTTAAEDGLCVEIAVVYKLSINDTYVDMTYTIYGDGSVAITTALRTTSNALLYRFGVDLVMPEGFENIDWLTKGELENLSDRSTGSFVGRYQTTVTDNFYSYHLPQDSGMRQGTRFMAVTDDEKETGLLVVAVDGHNFEANAQHFAWRDINDGSRQNKHSHTLRPRKDTVVSVSYASRGTGNLNPDVLPEYVLYAGNMEYSYTLVPFQKSISDPAVLSRMYKSDVLGEIEMKSVDSLASGKAVEIAVDVLGIDSKFGKLTVSLFGKEVDVVNGTATISLEGSDVPVVEEDIKEAMVLKLDDTIIMKKEITVKPMLSDWEISADFKEEGDNLNVKVKISNNTGTEKETTIITAVYDSMGRMIALSSQDKIIGGEIANLDFAVDISISAEAKSAKVFVWEKDMFVPLAKAVEWKKK